MASTGQRGHFGQRLGVGCTWFGSRGDGVPGNWSPEGEMDLERGRG